VNQTQRAYLSIFFISILWGTIPLIIKTTEISSLALVGARTFIGAVVLFLFIEKNVDNFKQLIKNGLVLGPLLAIHWAAMFESINLNSVAVGIGLVFTYPIFLILLNLFMGNSISKRQTSLVILGFFGVYLLLDVGQISSPLGVFYGLVSAIMIALLITYGEPLSKQLGGLNVAFSQVFIAALCLSPFTFNNIDWILNNIFISFFLGGVLTGLGLVIYWNSLKIITPLAVGTITYTEPLTGVLLSSLLLSESLALTQYIGFAIVLSVGIMQVLKVK
jgi:drug/metabolite transporter (DMT)-like permease